MLRPSRPWLWRDAPCPPPLHGQGRPWLWRDAPCPPPLHGQGRPWLWRDAPCPPPLHGQGRPWLWRDTPCPPPSPRSGAPLTVERCSVPPPPSPRSGAPLTVERCSVPPPSPRSGAPLTVERCPVPPPSPRSGAPLTVERCPVPPPLRGQGRPWLWRAGKNQYLKVRALTVERGGGNLPLALRGQGRPWLWRGGGAWAFKMDQKVVFVDLTAPCPPPLHGQGRPWLWRGRGRLPPPPFHGQSLDFQILIFQLSVSRLHRGLSLMSGRILGVFDLDLISRYENPQKTFKTNTKTTILRLFLYFWVIFEIFCLVRLFQKNSLKRCLGHGPRNFIQNLSWGEEGSLRKCSCGIWRDFVFSRRV